MSVINRIEFANLLNLDNLKPSDSNWQPHYRHVLLDLAGQSAAIVATNGTGKTTMNNALFAILAREARCQTDIKEMLAPKRIGVYSHVRIEALYLSAEEGVQSALPGVEAAGDRHVFGFYGNAGRDKLVFYTYRGRLEDVPVAHVDGTRKSITSNAEFHEALSQAASVHEDLPRKDYLSLVHQHFEPGLIRQLVNYQKRGGGDGAEHFFKVEAQRGEDYDSALFYTHIAPELLVDCMGDQGEEEEYAFEDTILASARHILRAERNLKRSQEKLARASEVFQALDDVRGSVRSYEASRGSLSSQIAQCRHETRLLEKLVQIDPLPGVPASMESGAEETRWVADRLVCAGGEWLLPDTAIAEILGSEAKTVNREAAERKVSGSMLRYPQVLEIPGHLKLEDARDPRGNPNQGFRLDGVLKLISHRTRFADGWSEDKASRAINYAFEWRTGKGESNPLRAEHTSLKQEIADLEARATVAERDGADAEKRYVHLNARVQQVQSDTEALSKLRRSGLFSAEEIDAPEQTSEKVEREVHEAQQAITRHQARHAGLEAGRQAFEAAELAHPDTPPADALTRLSAAQEAAAQAFRVRQEEEGAAEAAHEQAREEGEHASRALRALEKSNSEMEWIAPQLEVFDAVFHGESPDGLEEAVKRERDQARQERAQVAAAAQAQEQEQSGLLAAERAAEGYEALFGDVPPQGLEATVRQDLGRCREEIAKGKEKHRECEEALSRHRELGRQHAAILEAFGRDVAVRELEESLRAEVARVGAALQEARSEEKALRAAVQTLETFEARFPGEGPHAVLAARAERRAFVARRVPEAQATLNRLRKQRSDYARGEISPGTIPRQAAQHIPAGAESVHSVIREVATDPAHRKALLTQFALVLHNPVFHDSEQAVAVAAALDAVGVETPVFHRDGLVAFCQASGSSAYASIACLRAGNGLLAGTLSRQVQALFDPSLFGQLLSEMDQEIGALTRELDALAADSEDLDERSERSQLIRAAAKAYDDDARAQLAAVAQRRAHMDAERERLDAHLDRESLARIRSAVQYLEAGGAEQDAALSHTIREIESAIAALNGRLPQLEERASEAAIAIIREQVRYLDLGGRARLQDLAHMLAEHRQRLETIEATIPRLEVRWNNIGCIAAAQRLDELGGRARLQTIADELAKAGEAERVAAEALKSQEQAWRAARLARHAAQTRANETSRALSDEKHMLEAAIRYEAEGGPAFDADYERTLAECEANQKRAHTRSKFDFEAAQRAVTAARQPDHDRDLIQERDDAWNTTTRLREQAKEDREQAARLSDAANALASSVRELDEAAAKIIAQWRSSRSLLELVHSATDADLEAIVKESGHVDAARTLANAIATDTLDQGETIGSVMSDIAANVAEFELHQRRKDIESLRKEMASKRRGIEREADSVAERFADQWAPGEKDMLRAGDLQAVGSKIELLTRRYESYLHEEEGRSTKLAADVAAERERMQSSVMEFTDALQDNFDTLKRVLRRTTHAGGAQILIDGELVSRERLQKELVDIIQHIGIVEGRREDDAERGVHLEKEDAYMDRLKTEIRNSFYRAVFRAPPGSNATGPTIAFAHPRIGAGRRIRLTRRGVSTGQHNALALMILTKMADFTTSRDRNKAGAGLRRRRSGKSSGARMVMIDGLFSNLSNRRLIRESLDAMREMKGSFQLIGWIHNTAYENDFEIFPTYILVRRLGRTRGFVLAEKMPDGSYRAGADSEEVLGVATHVHEAQPADAGGTLHEHG